jgi:hypothetical protein
MSTLPEPPNSIDGPAPDPAPASEARRRLLLRGSMTAGPVLMTVMSRPVLGQRFCGTPSIGASVANGTSLACVTPLTLGLSPSNWCSPGSSWPSPYIATSQNQSGTTSTFSQTSGTNQATEFHSSTTGFQGSVFGTHTMRDVMRGRAGGGSYASLGAYIAAALLNAASGRTPYLDAATVRKMWNDNLLSGYYEPAPGIRWGSAQILTYLKSTMA